MKGLELKKVMVVMKMVMKMVTEIEKVKVRLRKEILKVIPKFMKRDRDRSCGS